MTYAYLIVAVFVALPLCGVVAFVIAMRKTMAETAGNRYYGLPAAERGRLKQRIFQRGRRLAPVLRLLGKLPPRLPTATFEGVGAPAMASSPASLEAAMRFVPGSRDVVVATQMKCGTTWMQQVAYEVIMHGRGDFSDAGHGHLYATSPWLEATFGVPLRDAPRLGMEGWRLIKTHLPADRCRYSPDARYIYVTRHPAACFESIVDFVRLLAGPLAPRREWLLDWYLSDRMWWRSWPENVESWWRRAQHHPNILFVHYEEMLSDLPGVVRRVAALLGVELRQSDLEEVVRKSSFAYMKANEEVFEMSPPDLLQGLSQGAYLHSGSRDRQRQGTDVERARIMSFCQERLAGRSYPFALYYPT
jgi:aryl sulfotransferase